MNTLGRTLLGLLLTAGTLAHGANVVYYVPSFDVFSEYLRYPDRPTTEGWRFWTSRCSVFNAGQEAIDISVLGLFGPEGPYEVPVPRPMTLGPLESGQLLTSNDRDIVQFAVIRAPENAVVRAEVERRQLVSSGCGSGAGSGRSADLGEGRAPLPVFREPFPAGATTIMGPVDLGSPRVVTDCVSGYQQHGSRRVNVTLFNAGGEEAVFLIRSFRMQGDPEPVLEVPVTLGPGRVHQVNGLPIFAAIAESGAPWRPQELAWVTVEATQPFLVYTSTVFIDPEPATLPFQVFPPTRIR